MIDLKGSIFTFKLNFWSAFEKKVNSYNDDKYQVKPFSSYSGAI